MTATHPRTGLSARLHRHARGVVAAFAVLACILSTGVASSAAAAEDAPEEDVAGTAELFLSAGMYGAIGEGSPVSTAITLVNGTELDISEGRVNVELNRTPLADADALTRWLDGGSAEGTFEALISDGSPPVAAGVSEQTSLFVPVDELGALTPGVYPIRASISGATTGSIDEGTLTAQNLVASSVLTVTPPERPQVGVLVPITATPANGGLLTAEELTLLTAADGALTAQLDAVGGTPAVLAVDPAIPAAIRVLGTAAPASAVAWLLQLEALPNDRFALQFGDADATTQAQRGLPHLLQPTTLSPYLDPANFIVTPDETAVEPTTTPSPALPELPTTDELTAIRGERDGLLWPGSALGEDDLAAFDDYVGGDATTVIASTSVTGATGAHSRVDDHDLLVADAAASRALSLAAAEDDPNARARALAAAVASLSFTGSDTAQLVALTRDETRTFDALRDSLTAIAAVGAPVGLTGLTTAPASRVELTSTTSPLRGDALRALLDDEDRLGAFSSILDDPTVLTAPERIKILRVIAVGTTDADFTGAVIAHRAATTTTLDSVGIQPPGPAQLLSAAAPLPVWVRNDLPWTVNVRLEARPSDARLDVQPYTEVEALAASNTRVRVPVEARVGSGELDVRFTLTSPTGVPIGNAQVADVTVRADWESIGLVILGSLVTLLIIVGIVRTVIRRRRAAADDAIQDPAAEDPAADKETDD